MKLVLAAVVTFASVSAAHADCGTPTWIGTPSGTTIPEHGSLYIFQEADRYNPYVGEDKVEFSDGVPHRWEPTRISDTVVRVDYAAGLASTVSVGVRGETHTYAIDPTWTPPARPPRVIQYWHHAAQWTCSHADSWLVQVDQPTAAFRVRFTPLDDLGTSIEYIAPAQVGTDGRSVLEIGKHDCVATPSIEPEMLARGGVLALFAIRFDGSEVEVAGLPAKMKTSDLRTSEGHLADAIGYAPLPPEATPPVSTNAGSGHAFLVIAGAGVGLLFIGLLLAGRRRTPLPVQM